MDNRHFIIFKNTLHTCTHIIYTYIMYIFNIHTDFIYIYIVCICLYLIYLYIFIFISHLLIDGPRKSNVISQCLIPFLPASSKATIMVQHPVVFLLSLTPKVCVRQLKASSLLLCKWMQCHFFFKFYSGILV